MNAIHGELYKGEIIRHCYTEWCRAQNIQKFAADLPPKAIEGRKHTMKRTICSNQKLQKTATVDFDRICLNDRKRNWTKSSLRTL